MKERNFGNIHRQETRFSDQTWLRGRIRTWQLTGSHKYSSIQYYNFSSQLKIFCQFHNCFIFYQWISLSDSGFDPVNAIFIDCVFFNLSIQINSYIKTLNIEFKEMFLCWDRDRVRGISLKNIKLWDPPLVTFTSVNFNFL